MVALALSLGVPSAGRARELSKRMVCSVNLKGIGATAKIYADANQESWMVPPFKASEIDQNGIDYLNNGGTTDSWPQVKDPGEVGWERPYATTSETQFNPNGGSRTMSVTRAFWMLVRSGDIVVEQLVCPSSPDTPDDTELLELYYDFTGYENISYGYQVPFGPRQTRARAGADIGQVFAADKGPYYLNKFLPNWNVGARGLVVLDDPPRTWRPFNSPNHGGRKNGEGQNCLFSDGAVRFKRKPAIGIDEDNIYTLLVNDWGSLSGFNRIHGDTPHLSATGGPPYPGQDAFGPGAGRFASTDSLLYP